MYRHVGYILLSAFTVSLNKNAFATNCQSPSSGMDFTPGMCVRVPFASVASASRNGVQLLTCQLLPVCIPAIWYATWTVRTSTSVPDITSISDTEDEYSGSGAPPKHRQPRSYGAYLDTSNIMIIDFITFNSTSTSIPYYTGTWNNDSDTRVHVNQSLLGIHFNQQNGSITLPHNSLLKYHNFECEVIACIDPTTTTSSQTHVPSTPPPNGSTPPPIRSTPSPSKSTESQTTSKVTTRKDVMISKIYSNTTAASIISSITSSHVVTSRTTNRAIAPSTTSHTEDEIIHTAIDEEEFVFLHSGHISINSDSNVLLIVAMSLLWIYIFI
ncbi:glycoprotein family protein m15 [Murid betaherpesvirus 1]|uniref:Glycoprotein family protein m15 n=1 Tax=Murid herpesvirus 1 (strain Smith) TaxID=10367 RepID=D3XDJ9_MUHVS|nr:glycoprotein family protein m15 [Murid betaherpesvirus 1]YP_214023.1 Glycoprotein family m02 [Murid betaherpesvirus 1]ADD10393.1 glycoprotein family protein m15 [Murid betaherpesvirus 1]AQQ81304.1 m15 protein [Murid betaherpesvirus 1]WEG71677.1 membrane protein m15 [Murid betaherpesvirus 1]CAJ1013235.1 m15 protein [Murid betaherpesvirus 1]CAJ1013403.1 m15 protein [Murid betaherpesvirus 1]